MFRDLVRRDAIRRVRWVLGWFFVSAVVFAPQTRAHGPLEDQIASLSRRLSYDSDNVDLLLERAGLYRATGRFEDARQDYEAARRYAPQRRDLDLMEGSLALEGGRPETAVRLLSRYLNAPPGDGAETTTDDVLARIERAHAYLALERYDAAIHDLERALAIHPTAGPVLYLELARAWLRGGEGSRAGAPAASQAAERALAVLDLGISRLGPVVSLQEPALEIEISRHRFDSALRRLDATYGASPRRDLWLVRRGELLWRGGKREEAVVAWNEARRVMAGLPLAHRAHPETRRRRQAVTRYLDLAASLSAKPAEPPGDEAAEP